MAADAKSDDGCPSGPGPIAAESSRLDRVEQRLGAMEDLICRLIDRDEPGSDGPGIPDFYTTEQFGRAVARPVATIRKWLRMGRIKAAKAPRRRGGKPEWRVSAVELSRYRANGLLPPDQCRNAR